MSTFVPLEQEHDESDLPPVEEFDELDREFVDGLIDKILLFCEALSGNPYHNYQRDFSRRLIESVVIRDAEVLTAVAARQTGKTELVANTVAGLMILLPRLARLFPKLLGAYKDGFWVGLFAPVEGQVETLYSRVVSRLTSERAQDILADPEIDDRAKRISGVTRGIRLEKCGSFLMMMTANPKAKIESKTFHLAVIDECQESDDVVVSKSISPMLAHYKGTMVKIGTPSFTKNNFYKSIQLNKRLQTRKGARQNHYQWNWKDVVKEVPDYGDFIKKEMLRIGEDSDEFQISYMCSWILERGMFVTQTVMDDLADTSMETVKAWHNSPVVVGIDPARKQDSTVVTVVWVDWDRPDEYDYFHHRVLNWLEIQGDDWEEQYHQIVDFLSHYNVLAIGVDANGVGDAVAQRLALLIPRAEVIALTSSQQEQSERFKHLQALIQRGQIAWPGNAKARRLRTWKRFYQQMLDAEKDFKGSNFMVHAPDEPHAHDDYVDSLSIATALTRGLTLPTVQVSRNPFF